MEDLEKLERNVEMLRYSIENNQSQLAFFDKGSLEEKYAQKLIASCQKSLAEKEKELAARRAGDGQKKKDG